LAANRRVSETSKGKIARRFDPMDDRALIDEAKVEIEDVVADEEIALDRQFPKPFDDFGLFSLKHLDFSVCGRLDGVAEAKNLRGCRR